MPFDPMSDKVALTIPAFTLKKHVDSAFQRYNEPYILSLAIDESSGIANPAIDFSMMPFPKVAKGGTVNMLGDGHIVYGPKNPGEWLALSVLVMENDQDMKTLGANIEQIVSSRATGLGMKALIAANPGSAAVLGLLKELTVLVSGFLKGNKDDELYRTEGTFLRDHAVPYHVNRSYEVGNDFVDLSLNVLPLDAGNGQGPSPKKIVLA